MTDYKPGTVAIATVHDVPNVRVFRRDGDWAYVPEPERGIHYSCASDVEGLVTDVRPLVVLDPDDAQTMDQLANSYHAVDDLELDNSQPMTFGGLAMRAALRSLTKPPKPAEPTGLGAVVEDDKGKQWARALDDDAPWCRRDGGARWAGWQYVNAVRVLSEGVTA